LGDVLRPAPEPGIAAAILPAAPSAQVEAPGPGPAPDMPAAAPPAPAPPVTGPVTAPAEAPPATSSSPRPGADGASSGAAPAPAADPVPADPAIARAEPANGAAGQPAASPVAEAPTPPVLVPAPPIAARAEPPEGAAIPPAASPVVEASPPPVLVPSPPTVAVAEPPTRVEPFVPAPRTRAATTPMVGPVGAARLDPALLATMLRRGEALLEIGDISGARRFLERAAEGGSAAAARALAETYDAALLARRGAVGITPDPAAAAAWYRRAELLRRAEADPHAGTPGAAR
jgi:hypothetical protein